MAGLISTTTPKVTLDPSTTIEKQISGAQNVTKPTSGGILNSVVGNTENPNNYTIADALKAAQDEKAAVGNMTGPGEVALPRQIAPEETVSGQLNKLLSSDSSYIQSARNKGMETANSRGLINSSLAAGTSERAAIDAAAPIATSDANIFANSAQAAQNANISSSLQSQKSQQDAALAKQNADATYKLNQDMKQMGIDADKELKQMDIDYNLQNLDATSRDNFTKSIGSINQQYLDAIKGVYQAANLSPETRDTMIANLRTERDATLKATAAAAGFTIDLSKISVAGTSGGPAPGTVSPTDTKTSGHWEYDASQFPPKRVWVAD